MTTKENHMPKFSIRVEKLNKGWSYAPYYWYLRDENGRIINNLGAWTRRGAIRAAKKAAKKHLREHTASQLICERIIEL